MRRLLLKASVLVLLALPFQPLFASPADKTGGDRLEQFCQHRELRLKQALRNGDVTEQDAARLRERWAAQDGGAALDEAGQDSGDAWQRRRKAWLERRRQLRDTPESMPPGVDLQQPLREPRQLPDPPSSR